MEQNSRVFPGVLPSGDISAVSANIPAGVFSCRFDDKLTLLQMNDEFLSMLGYTRQDIHALFKDSFLSMIYPPDRDNALHEVERRLQLGNEEEIEYRIADKSGRLIWVLDRRRLICDAAEQYLCCLLIDITSRKEAERRLRLSLERHQIIMDQSNSIIFDWDIQADTFSFSSKWMERLGTVPLTQHVSQHMNDMPHVLEEDKLVFAGVLRRILDGEKLVEAEVRIINDADARVWHRVRITSISDESGRVVRAVGVLMDIDSEKRQSEILIERAQRDGLTRLYNKAACQERIEKALANAVPGFASALLIIDLDNFKNMNDSMGHLFGDALLVEVAHALQAQFRSNDVVGRVGGDEFIAFIDQIPGIEVAEQKAAHIMEALKEMSMRELPEMSIFCSIGISVAPDCGHTYNELFRSADEALYCAKNLGRNQYCTFNPVQAISNLTILPRSAVNTRIESDEAAAESINSKLVSYVFHILYRANDLDSAVNDVLRLVGEQFDVSRAYIFECYDDNSSSNKFEWCNVGVTSQMDGLQDISNDTNTSGDYYANFDENGLFYCRDISTLSETEYALLDAQGIKSMLQCAVYDSGKLCGFVGFDECRANRFWTRGQIDSLTLVSEILGAFLFKTRAKYAALQNADAMQSILDTRNAWIYIVRPDTLELLYANPNAGGYAMGTGDACYEVLFGLKSQCELCPMRGLSAGHTHHLCQVYNPLLNIWASADARPIKWRGSAAILVSCYDMTEFKK